MDPIIEVKNATVYRGSTRVFSNLSLSIQNGEHTAILGPNGSGKSTFLRLLSQDLYPVKNDKSWVRLFGKNRWEVSQLRRHMGIISHDLQIHYKGSVLSVDVVLSGFYGSIGIWPHQHYSREEHETTRALLSQFDVSHLAARPYHSLSTGEQRRIILARALVHDPSTLVLDEPTSGLDLKASFQYVQLIRSLIRQGKTMLLVTHHIHEIPPEITRIVLLKEGKVLADGHKSEILTSTTMSALYDIPLQILQGNGYYQVVPQ